MGGQRFDLKGVKGWLLLLVVNLAILDPFANLFNLAVGTHFARSHLDQNPPLQRLLLINGACSIGLAVFSIYAGISLWRVLPNAVILAKRYLGAAFGYSVLSLFLPHIVGLSDELRKEVTANSLLNSFITALYLYGWYQYLRRSKRVKATYGTMGDEG